ncbi:MAG: cytochrome c biogenesis protein CcsA [Pseudomonadota bacterium]
MATNLMLNLTALLALVPASIASFRRAPHGPDLVFWAVLAAALAGPLAFGLSRVGSTWQTDLSTALWISIAVSLAIFAGLAALTRAAWRLAPLLLPYLLLLALLATVWSNVPGSESVGQSQSSWLAVHIAVSVVTYALATLAAVSGAAVFLQEMALKRKWTSSLPRLLPAIADGERLELRLLAAAETVLGIGIVSGMALQYFAAGQVFAFDHKTLLSLTAFAVIGALLIWRQVTGLRGRRAARLVLLAYLLLTLAYPGVKFVSDVLIG